MKKYYAAVCAVVFAMLAVVFLMAGEYESMYGCISSSALSAIWAVNEYFIEKQEEYIEKLRKRLSEVAG